jgi:MFS family permease
VNNLANRKLDAYLTELLGPLNDGSRRLLAFLFLNVISWMSVIGTILVLHARALGIDTVRIGILNSFLFFTNVLGLFSKPLAERIGSRRMLLSGWTLRNILVAPVVLTPIVYAYWGVDGATILLGATTLLFCVTRSLAGIALNSWEHEVIPPEHLARFYTLETIQTRLVFVAFGVISYFVLGQHPPLWRFAAIAGVGVIIGLMSIRVVMKVPGGAPPAHKHEDADKPWYDGFDVALRDRDFTGYLACGVLSSFAFAGQGLFFTLLLRDRLGLGPGVILAMVASGSLLTVVTSMRWRRVADSHGSPVTIAATTLLMTFCIAGMAPLSTGHAPLAFVLLLCLLIPIAETGTYVAATRAVMLLMNPRHRHAYNAIWAATFAIGCGISSVLVGWLLRGGEAWHYTAMAAAFALLMLAASVRFIRLKENGRTWRDVHTQLFDARRPLVGMVRIWCYVMHLGSASHDIGPKKST